MTARVSTIHTCRCISKSTISSCGYLCAVTADRRSEVHTLPSNHVLQSAMSVISPLHFTPLHHSTPLHSTTPILRHNMLREREGEREGRREGGRDVPGNQTDGRPCIIIRRMLGMTDGISPVAGNAPRYCVFILSTPLRAWVGGGWGGLHSFPRYTGLGFPRVSSDEKHSG